MSYNCEVSNNPFSTFPTWSFLIFSLILILGALIPFITGASFGIIVNWVLDFSQSNFYSNRQRIYPQEVFYRIWTFQLSFTPVFHESIQFLRMNQDLLFFLYVLLLIVLVSMLTPPFWLHYSRLTKPWITETQLVGNERRPCAFLYLLLIFLSSLLLGPNYILAVIKLGQILNKHSDE